MAGIIVELILSWILLWVICKKHLGALGFKPTKKSGFNFLFGFSAAAVCCVIYYLSFTVLGNSSWILNKDISTWSLVESCWWVVKSVVYEELIFRGALLYMAIKKLGPIKACLLSAVAFGIYHWFSMGAFGNPAQMVIIFFMTGIWGFMFAMAFAKTGSLYLPFALHLGWNLFNTVVFSEGPLGNQLYIPAHGQPLHEILSMIIFIFQVLSVPLLTYGYLKNTRFKLAKVKSKNLIRNI